MTPILTWPADDYHPHYPDITKDYYGRLMASADKMGNRFRLAFHVYPDEPVSPFKGGFCRAEGVTHNCPDYIEDQPDYIRA